MIGSPKSFFSRHENHSAQFHKDVRVQNLYKESFLEHFLQIPKINLIEFRVHLFELGQKVMHVRYQTNVHRLNYQDHRSLLSVHMQSANVHGQSANYSCQNAILVCQTALLMCQTAILVFAITSFHGLPHVLHVKPLYQRVIPLYQCVIPLSSKLTLPYL